MAQAHYGVIPDLSVFSKALANGYPLAVVAGKADVFERASEAWISGTYHGGRRRSLPRWQRSRCSSGSRLSGMSGLWGTIDRGI